MTVLCGAMIQSVQIVLEWLRQRFSKVTSSPVLSCDSACVLRVIVGRSHWNCYIMGAIWSIGFARNLVFFRLNGGSVAEKSWLARAAVLGVVAFAAESSSMCERSGTDVSRSLFLFFVAAVLLCFACVEILCALKQYWNWCVKAVCSTVARCNSLVLCHSVCADRIGKWLRQRFSKGTCYCCPVLSCEFNCLLQVTVVGSHWNCYHIMAGCELNVRFCRKQFFFYAFFG